MQTFDIIFWCFWGGKYLSNYRYSFWGNSILSECSTSTCYNCNYSV